MAGTAVRGRLTWQVAKVASVLPETPSVRTIVLEVPDWAGHRAGQHVDIRLTAEDGYSAERSYSIASAPGEPLSITVERLEDGEVSPYLTEELRPDDEIEIRGPIGGYFVWDGGDDRPLLLLAGGSGIVPLRSIMRYRAHAGNKVRVRVLYSSRSWTDLIYRDELDSYRQNGTAEILYTLTRHQPSGWAGHSGRIDATWLAEQAWPAHESPVAYVCGPTSFVESVAETLVSLSYPAAAIKTERFGASGGQR